MTSTNKLDESRDNLVQILPNKCIPSLILHTRYDIRQFTVMVQYFMCINLQNKIAARHVIALVDNLMIPLFPLMFLYSLISKFI